MNDLDLLLPKLGFGSTGGWGTKPDGFSTLSLGLCFFESHGAGGVGGCCCFVLLCK